LGREKEKGGVAAAVQNALNLKKRTAVLCEEKGGYRRGVNIEDDQPKFFSFGGENKERCWGEKEKGRKRRYGRTSYRGCGETPGGKRGGNGTKRKRSGFHD